MQKELFPAPEQMFEWANNAGLKTALNLHPASGIQPYEECYDRFCKEYGWDQPGKSVPFKIDEKKWADAYYKTVLRPIEDQGNTFWWLDWQQWKESKYNPGLSNTFWLNHVFYNYAKDNYPYLRPFLYHRWGGLGSHRYPIGFSGDTIITWESLEYQPEFTATSANVTMVIGDTTSADTCSTDIRAQRTRKDTPVGFSMEYSLHSIRSIRPSIRTANAIHGSSLKPCSR